MQVLVMCTYSHIDTHFSEVIYSYYGWQRIKLLILCQNHAKVQKKKKSESIWHKSTARILFPGSLQSHIQTAVPAPCCPHCDFEKTPKPPQTLCMEAQADLTQHIKHAAAPLTL